MRAPDAGLCARRNVSILILCIKRGESLSSAYSASSPFLKVGIINLGREGSSRSAV